MAKRPPINTVAEENRIMTAAFDKIEPPVPLDARERACFDSILAEKARADWTGHKIGVACILARLMVHATDYPRDNTAVSSILALRRSLGLHACAEGDSRDRARRDRLGLKTERGAYAAFDDDDLIARPTPRQ